MTTRLACEIRDANDMILPILSRVSEALRVRGRNDQVDGFLRRAETCNSREELVRLAKRYVRLDD